MHSQEDVADGDLRRPIERHTCDRFRLRFGVLVCTQLHRRPNTEKLRFRFFQR